MFDVDFSVEKRPRRALRVQRVFVDMKGQKDTVGDL
jgi:hypothetical protein